MAMFLYVMTRIKGIYINMSRMIRILEEKKIKGLRRNQVTQNKVKVVIGERKGGWIASGGGGEKKGEGGDWMKPRRRQRGRI